MEMGNGKALKINETQCIKSQIDANTNILDVLVRLGYERSNNGGEKLWNRCHDSKAASVSVRPDSNYARDFGEPGLHGGPVDWIMKTLDCDITEAARWVEREFGIKIGMPNPGGAAVPSAPPAGPTSDILRVWTLYARHAHEALKARPDIRAELPYSDSTIDRLQIGFDDRVIQRLIRDKEITEKQANEAGFGVSTQDPPGRFFHRVIYPFLAADGNGVLSFAARARGVREPKYLYPHGAKLSLYNLPAVLEARQTQQPIMLCEGISDTVAAVEAGHLAAGAPGATSPSRKLLAPLTGVPRVIVCFDRNDAGGAGDKGAETACRLLGSRARLLELPNPDNRPGYDLTDYLAEHDPDELNSIIAEIEDKTPLMLTISRMPQDTSLLNISNLLEPLKLALATMPQEETEVHFEFIYDHFSEIRRDWLKELKASIREVRKTLKNRKSSNVPGKGTWCEDILLTDEAAYEPVMTARRRDIPNLLGIVRDDTDGDRDKLGIIEDGTVNAYDSYLYNEVLYIPADTTILKNAVLLPRLSEIRKYTESDDDEELYGDLLYFQHWKKVEMPYDEDIHVLTAYDFLTHFYNRFHFYPGLLFTGEPSTCKSGAMQSVIDVSPGILIETVNDARLLRIRNDWELTVALDCYDLWRKAVNAGSEDILLGFWEQGMSALRVLYPDRGAYKDTISYQISGPLLSSSNKRVDSIFATRNINFKMLKLQDAKRLASIERSTKESALPFKERLYACYVRRFEDAMPKVSFRSTTSDGRYEDIVSPLISMVRLVAPSEEKFLKKALFREEKSRTAVRSDSYEARLLQAIWDARNFVDNAEIPMSKISNAFNINYPDKKSQISGRKAGDHLCNIMGFERLGRGKIRWNEAFIREKAKHYGILDYFTDEKLGEGN